MAVYSAHYGYIFFANPQTASKAIARTLEKELDGKALHKALPPDKKAGLKRLHHLTYDAVLQHELIPREELRRLVRVTGVRNPYDVLVSRYLKHRQRFTADPERYPWVDRDDKPGLQRSIATAAEKSFPEWLRIQYGEKIIAKTFRDYLDQADVVIRFEAMQDDFNTLLERLGVDWPVTVARENVTVERRTQGSQADKRAYADYYDEDSRQLVGRIFRPVLDRFGYRFEE